VVFFELREIPLPAAFSTAPAGRGDPV